MLLSFVTSREMVEIRPRGSKTCSPPAPSMGSDVRLSLIQLPRPCPLECSHNL